jgi:hypothetical protein
MADLPRFEAIAINPEAPQCGASIMFVSLLCRAARATALIFGLPFIRLAAGPE